MLSKKGSLIYILIIFIILCVPSVGMIFNTGVQNTGAEKRDLSELPEILNEDGSYNINLLGDFGDYFSDNFAFRENYITADHLVYSSLLGSSVNDEVIIGDDGWLFYHGTLNDYLGKSRLSQRELFNISHNLSLIQNRIETDGRDFLFIIAPNKNSLYGDYMPSNYIKSDGSNASSLLTMLIGNNINTIDLFELLNSQNEVLYLKRDTHWNNKGAYLVYSSVMDYLNKDSSQTFNWSVRNDYRGDLDEMFFPLYAVYEEQYYKNTSDNYTIKNDAEDNMSPFIEAYNPKAADSLFMFRDSFGAALVPFFAENFEYSYFSRYVPYDIESALNYNTEFIIIEKAERNLIDLTVKPAVMTAPKTDTISQYESVNTDSGITIKEDGSYTILSGQADINYINNATEIYLNITDNDGNTSTFELFYSTNEQRLGNEYYAYFDASYIDSAKSAELIVKFEKNYYNIASISLGGTL